jgi:hypothetical protein
VGWDTAAALRIRAGKTSHDGSPNRLIDDLATGSGSTEFAARWALPNVAPMRSLVSAPGVRAGVRLPLPLKRTQSCCYRTAILDVPGNRRCRAAMNGTPVGPTVPALSSLPPIPSPSSTSLFLHPVIPGVVHHRFSRGRRPGLVPEHDLPRILPTAGIAFSSPVRQRADPTQEGTDRAAD